MDNIGKGGMRLGLQMRNFEKKYFDSYSDAEIWLLNGTDETDGEIRKEGGRYYIFVRSQEAK